MKKLVSCAAAGCPVTSRSVPEVHLIRFPANPQRFRVWSTIAEIPSCRQARHLSLCANHFFDRDFLDPQKTKLRPGSDPQYTTRQYLDRTLHGPLPVDVPADFLDPQTTKLRPGSDPQYTTRQYLDSTLHGPLPVDVPADRSVSFCGDVDDESFGHPLSSSTPLRPKKRNALGEAHHDVSLDHDQHSVPDDTSQTPTRTRGFSILGVIGNTRYAQLTPRKQQLVQEIRRQRKALGVLKKELKRRKGNLLRNSRRENSSEVSMVKKFAESMSTPCANIMVSQIRCTKRKPRGRRWTMAEKVLAVAIYKHSPRCYKFLSTIFTLPTCRTLTSLINHIPLNPGINEHIFSSIKDKICQNSDLYKYCVLMWDEMSTRQHLFYVKHEDVIFGYEDLGEGRRSANVAHHALVFMAVGLFHDWQQPLAYYFTSRTMQSSTLRDLILSVIAKCRAAGLIVSATVCDGHSVNRRAYLLLNCNADNPSFSFEGHTIFALYDPPHLLKCTRNLLLDHDLQFESDVTINGVKLVQTASWSDVKGAWEDDRQNPTTRLLHKVTQDHINPIGRMKMKVKLAAQIFSRSMSAYIHTCVRHKVMSPKSVGTADLCEFFNNLFDSVNGTAATPEGGGTGLRCRLESSREALHVKFWEQAEAKLKSMKYVSGENSQKAATSATAITLNGWIRTIRGIRLLWESLKKDLLHDHPNLYLRVRRLDQDPLENLFGGIRGKCGANYNPSAYQFVAALKTCLLNGLVDASQSTGGNCESSFSNPPEVLDSLEGFLTKEVGSCRPHQGMDIETPDSFTMPRVLVEPDLFGHKAISVAYVNGFAVSRLFKVHKHNYDACRSGLVASDPNEYPALTGIETREFSQNVNGLAYPSKGVTGMFGVGLQLVKSVLETEGFRYCVRQHIAVVLFQELDTSWLQNYCIDHGSFVAKNLIESMCFIFIPWWCTERNRLDRAASKRAATRKMNILQHQ